MVKGRRWGTYSLRTFETNQKREGKEGAEVFQRDEETIPHMSAYRRPLDQSDVEDVAGGIDQDMIDRWRMRGAMPGPNQHSFLRSIHNSSRQFTQEDCPYTTPCAWKSTAFLLLAHCWTFWGWLCWAKNIRTLLGGIAPYPVFLYWLPCAITLH